VQASTLFSSLVAQLQCAVNDMSALHAKSGIDLKFRPGVGSQKVPEWR